MGSALPIGAVIDLACADREALDDVLQELGFTKAGRYWVHRGLDIAVEAPASGLPGKEAPRETVELEGGLSCIVIGLEDLIIDWTAPPGPNGPCCRSSRRPQGHESLRPALCTT